MNENELTVVIDEQTINQYDRKLPLIERRRKTINQEKIGHKVNETIDQLINQNTKDGKRVYWKAITLNIIDKFIRFISIGSTLITGILGINLLTNPNDKGSAMAVTILGFTATFTIQLNSEFNFRDRANVLWKCYQRYDDANDELSNLKLSDDPPTKVFKKVKRLKKKLKTIDITEFDSSIVDIDPGYRLSKTASADISKTNDYIRHRQIEPKQIDRIDGVDQE